MWTQRLMWIAWPAFMVAGILEMQAIGDLGDRQRGASQKLFRTKELLL